MTKKVVLDANIFVSALLVSDSNAAKILDLARGGELELLISPGILEEIARVLQYPKLDEPVKSKESDSFVKSPSYGAQISAA